MLRSILSSRRRGGDQTPIEFWRNWITTPSAPQRRLRNILLMSRPPLLDEEGKMLASTDPNHTAFQEVGSIRSECEYAFRLPGFRKPTNVTSKRSARSTASEE